MSLIDQSINWLVYLMILSDCSVAIGMIVSFVCLWHCALWLNDSFCGQSVWKWMGSVPLGTQFCNFQPLHWLYPVIFPTPQIWKFDLFIIYLFLDRPCAFCLYGYKHSRVLSLRWCIVSSKLTVSESSELYVLSACISVVLCYRISQLFTQVF